MYRVLKCDVIKMKFLKLWDLLGYSERTMSKRPTCQKCAFRGKLSLRSYPSKFFWGRPPKNRRVCMEFSGYNRLNNSEKICPEMLIFGK